MCCTKNPRKFLFMKWNGPHTVVELSVKRVYPYSCHTYEIHHVCDKCKASMGYSLHREEKMLSKGYDLKKLERLGSMDLFSTPALELKQ